MAKHAAPYIPEALDAKDAEAPKHRATPVEEQFVPIRDVWATADDIKQQRHDFEFERLTNGGR